MRQIRELIRDVCLIACAEFLPLMHIGMGNGFLLKLAVALFIKLHLFAALSSSAAYLTLQLWAGIALAIHFLGRGLMGWPQLPERRQPSQAPGVGLLTQFLGLPHGLNIVIAPLAALAFAWWTLDSPPQAPYPPLPGWDIADWLVSMGVFAQPLESVHYEDAAESVGNGTWANSWIISWILIVSGALRNS